MIFPEFLDTFFPEKSVIKVNITYRTDFGPAFVSKTLVDI